MMSPILEQVSFVLQQYKDPYLGQSWVDLEAVKQISEDQGDVAVDIVLGYPAANIKEALVHDLTKKIQAIPGVKNVAISMDWGIDAHGVPGTSTPVEGVKNIIAVASGKGGVGKSTTAANLALSLMTEGARVGLLDADIYGPNQPHMLGHIVKAELADKKRLKPVDCYGLQTMSMGYLIDVNTPMVWRGPMVSTALQQLLRDTVWDKLDYLIIDLPPGTGDVQLTLAQKVPVTGAIIVTTPQEVALLDARKGIEMFKKVNVPILGIVENMSHHVCSECGHESTIFGSGGGEQLAEACEVELLGKIPLDMRLREDLDKGKPTTIRTQKNALTLTYQEIARKMTAKLWLEPKNYAVRFPKIVVE